MAFNPLVMMIGVFIFIWLFQIRNGNRLEHSRDITKNFQNPEILLHREKGSLALDAVESYLKEINEHLEDNRYKDLKEIIDRRNIYIKLHNQELNVFCNTLTNDVLTYIKERNFIKFNEFYSKDTIKSDILGVFCSNYQSPMLSFRIYSHDTFHDLICTHNQNIWIESDNKKEIEEAEKEIIKIYNDAIADKKFKLLLCYYNEIRAYQTKIDIKLNQIIDGIRNKATPLKGKCSKCLKENFFGDI